MIKVIPRPGLEVIDPDSKEILPPDGRIVIMSSFWERRRIDGDVTIEETGATEG